MTWRPGGRAALLAVLAALGALWGCGGASYDVASAPPDVRAGYEVFKQRCSKCHSLARPLASGIDDDQAWDRYVERMRLMPGSGISLSDKAQILVFLHYYALDLRKRRAAREAPTPPGDAGGS